jgi:hypothetical protein
MEDTRHLQQPSTLKGKLMFLQQHGRLSFLPLLFALSPLLSMMPGCASPSVNSSPVLVDPNRTAKDSGGTDDIYEATQQAISSLMNSRRLREQQGNRVVLDLIINNTGIPDYDGSVIYNKFLSDLTESTDDKLVFLNREAVIAERQRQQSGEVQTSGLPEAAGADMTLTIELRQLPGAATQTIQYTFKLTSLTGELVWTHSLEIKKAR